LGHTLGACGGIALVVCVKSLQNGVIPPTINLENLDPVCDLDYTPKTAREKNYRVAMSNSFGFGGHNASIVIGKLS
jgi:3-oxoacyl-[acyl-carrier-protein] synthase II